METSPDQGNATPPMGPQMTREQALAKVKPPAIALIVTAGIGILLAVLGILANVLNISVGTMEAANGGNNTEIWTNLAGGGLGLVQSIIGIIVGALIIMGAMKMMQLQTWSFALTVSIIAMVPFASPCCLLGLPFGIWAIIVLADNGVKAHFDS